MIMSVTPAVKYGGINLIAYRQKKKTNNMEITEYQDIIQKTAIYPKHLGPAYTTLGLIGELGEFAVAIAKNDEPNIKKEAGDVFWYITATCNEFHILVEEAFQLKDHKWPNEYGPDNCADEAIFISTEVSELVKKYCRDGNIDISRLTLGLNIIFTQVLMAANHYGIEFEEILEANYTKLIKRRETDTLHGSGDNREEVLVQTELSNI